VLLAVDQHRRRRVVRQQQLAHELAVLVVAGRHGPPPPPPAHDGAAVARTGRELDRGAPRRPDAPVDAPALDGRLEQPVLVADALRLAQHQVAARVEREVEQQHQLVLLRGLEVDQQVAAADQVQDARTAGPTAGSAARGRPSRATPCVR
jgi:hypothetical protein